MEFKNLLKHMTLPAGAAGNAAYKEDAQAGRFSC